MMYYPWWAKVPKETVSMRPWKIFHLANNEMLNTDDHTGKLKPIVSKLQEKFCENNYLDEHVSIDESC